jgi:exonuclease VII small subunit
VAATGDSERELREGIARLDAEITVFERVETLSERGRADLEARRARRDQLAAALAALRSTD